MFVKEGIMNKKQRSGILFLGFLMLFTLACRFGMELPWNAGGQDIQISPEDVSEAATRAAQAAATAGFLTNQVGGIAATAVAQGSDIVATAQILATPDPGNLAAGATALEQKLANIQPDANGNFIVALTETDFNEFVSGQTGGGFQTEGLRVENVLIDLTTEAAKLTGDVQEPVALPLTVEMRPTIQDGRLYFEIISATAGIFPAPTALLDLIELTANSELTQVLAGLPPNLTLQDVQLGDDVLMIMGREN
jgi:hypothetical protein